MILGRTALVFGKVIERRLAEMGLPLNGRQLGLLTFLSSDDLLIQQDLADIMCKDKSAVLRIVDSLEEKGFITRKSDPADRRKKIIVLTPAGNTLLEKAREIEKEVTSLLQQGLTAEEVATFIKVARHIQDKATSHAMEESH